MYGHSLSYAAGIDGTIVKYNGDFDRERQKRTKGECASKRRNGGKRTGEGEISLSSTLWSAYMSDIEVIYHC
jgi:hypothetical protein